MRDARMNEAVWMKTRLVPCTLKVCAVCHSGVPSASSPPRNRTLSGSLDRQNSIMRHQGASAFHVRQPAYAFDKTTLDPKNAFPRGMATRDIAVILNDTTVP